MSAFPAGAGAEEAPPFAREGNSVAIRYWLLKTEPTIYSFEDLLRQKHEVWDGITNPLALQHLRKARGGDLTLIYHSGKSRAAVGIARILGAPYPDPAHQDPKRTVIDIEPVRHLTRSVTLEEMKKNPKLRRFDLFRLPRLSVVPVSATHWKIILKMGQTPRS